VLQREQARAEMGDGRDLDWDRADERRPRRRARRLRRGRRHRPALHPLHLRHHREAQGHRTATTAATPSPALVDAQPSTASAGRDDVHRQRRRLGRRPLLHRLRPLLTGATTIVYEGKPVGTPDAGAFWRIIVEYGAVRCSPPHRVPRDQEGGPGGRAAGGLRPVSSCGGSSSPASGSTPTPTTGPRQARRPGRRQLVADRDRLADRGQPARPRGAADQAGLAVRARARLRRAGPRRDRRARCRPAPRARSHQAARCPPAPCRRCGTTTSATSRYLSAYDGYYLTGDGGYIDEDGYVYVMGRTDDVLNVAGHRLSTGSIEAALAGHPDVAECAVIGVADDFKGQLPRGFVVLKAGVDARPSGERIKLKSELVQRVRDEVGAVARCGRSTSSGRCPRRARARSCARRCGRSPTARAGRRVPALRPRHGSRTRCVLDGTPGRSPRRPPRNTSPATAGTARPPAAPARTPPGRSWRR
jgi:hypothetical protein